MFKYDSLIKNLETLSLELKEKEEVIKSLEGKILASNGEVQRLSIAYEKCYADYNEILSSYDNIQSAKIHQEGQLEQISDAFMDSKEKINQLEYYIGSLN